MKKIFFGLCLLSLAAAGCSSTNNATQTTSQNSNANQSSGQTTLNPSQTDNSKVAIAGAKVYSNLQYHFQMSVPQNDNPTVSSNPNSVNVSFLNSANTLDINISAEDTTKTLKQKVDEFNMYQGNPKIEETNTTIVGVPAVRAIENLSKGGSNIWYLIVSNGSFYWLVKGPGLTNEQFDSMVNTFSFTK